MATDIQTRDRVWVSHSHTLEKPQLNSHRVGPFGNSLKNEGVDGLTTVELAGLVTDYDGLIYGA